MHTRHSGHLPGSRGACPSRGSLRWRSQHRRAGGSEQPLGTGCLWRDCAADDVLFVIYRPHWVLTVYARRKRFSGLVVITSLGWVLTFCSVVGCCCTRTSVPSMMHTADAFGACSRESTEAPKSHLAKYFHRDGVRAIRRRRGNGVHLAARWELPHSAENEVGAPSESERPGFESRLPLPVFST